MTPYWTPFIDSGARAKNPMPSWTPHEKPWILWRSIQSFDRLHHGWRSLPSLQFATMEEAQAAYYARHERGQLSRTVLRWNGGPPGKHLDTCANVDFTKPKQVAQWKAERAALGLNPPPLAPKQEA